MSIDYDDEVYLLPRRPSSGPAYDYDKCPWCHHDWHGLDCCYCSCDIGRMKPDDTWRPLLWSTVNADSIKRIMHDTGCDGWAAMECLAPGRRSVLYGQKLGIADWPDW